MGSVDFGILSAMRTKVERQPNGRPEGQCKAQNTYSGLVESGMLAKITEHATNKALVGSPSHIITMLRKDVSGKYRR